MFKDYYQLLGIFPSASKQEIKQAYRRMSLKWHPDKNAGIDVTEIMQDINEAYEILSNDISRTKYNKEYDSFVKQYESRKPKQNDLNEQSWNYDYEVNDEDLRNDINEARKHAKDLVDEFFKSLKETSKVAAKGAWDGAYGYILGGILATIIFALIRTCESVK
ncbi:J domain-containing protein [Prevotella sp. oral taxon 475]|uniref:J domain-containing protein n=1 Tax=Prevotella sp. oral taxon 475 TaxID=712471 RepID=UPI001BA58721|nr:DnaJ domain-containing protein [Prevotella sp. oral taxon 475]QUB47679.1 J domain-containing protein [Prevotella sp. oral taxon 475]